MDDIVRQALRKWPNVPHCFDWLALDARGNWYMRDDRIQRSGPFPEVKGSRIEHEKLRAFIERNYLCDDAGCWFFQNGPQRVYVQLEAAPWVWRLAARADGAAPDIASHTGVPATGSAAWLDEHGRLFLATDLGFGVVHSLDMETAADAIEAARWTLQEIPFAELPARFGYVLKPAPAPAPGTAALPRPGAAASPT